MPKNIIATVAGAALTGAAIGFAIVTGGLGTPLAIAVGTAFFGGTLGIGLLSGSQDTIFPNSPGALRAPFTQIAQERTQMIKSSIAPHRLVYGEAMISGPIVAAFGTGTNKEYLHLVVALTGREIESIDEVWVNDEISTDAKFTPVLRVKLHLGSDTQLKDVDLQNDVGAGIWTDDHRLRGIAYAYLRLKWDADVWRTGIPNFKFKVKGHKVYNPITDVTEYSNNAALCQLDFLTTANGINASFADEVESDVVIAAINLCDENVALDAGGDQKRYTCNGTFTLNQRPIDIMNDLLTASVGSMSYQQGKYRLYAGAWSTPVAQTFGDDDLRGPIVGQTKAARSETYNAVRGTFVNKDDYYQATDFPPVTNSTFETQDGGLRLYRNIELPFTDDHIRCQRIAKIHLMRSRQGIVFTAPMKLTAYEISPWDVIQFNDAQMSWVDKTFRVLKRDLSKDGGIDLLLQEDVSGDWGWSSTEENSYDAVPTPTLPDPGTVAAPTGLTLESGAAQLLQQADGTVVSRIKVSWTLVPDEFVLNGGNYEIQFKKSADADYTTAAIISGDVAFMHIAAVEDGTNYDVRVRAINTAGVRSAWATDTGHTVVGQTGAPGIPQNLVVQGGILQWTIFWDLVSDTDIAYYVLQKDSDPGMGTAFDIYKGFTINWVEDAGQNELRYFRVAAVNRSGVQGGWSDVASATTAGVNTLQIVDEAIEELQIATDAITNTKIEDDAITSPKILAGEVKAVNIAAGAVIAGKIFANSIVGGDLSVSTAIITVAAQMGSAVIETASIKNLAVETAKIGNLQVSTIKIGNNQVTTIGSANNDSDETYDGEEVILSVTFTTNNGEASILVHSVFSAGGTAGTFYSSRFRIREDDISGTILEQMTLFCVAGGREMTSPAARDTSVPNGSKTYVFTAEKLNGTSALCGPSYMLAINYKK